MITDKHNRAPPKKKASEMQEGHKTLEFPQESSRLSTDLCALLLQLKRRHPERPPRASADLLKVVPSPTETPQCSREEG